MKLRTVVFGGALMALMFPLAALAQMPPDGQGPPPEVRARFEQARTQAKTAAFNDLSPDHRAKIQAISAQVQDGSLDRRAASAQIDAMLSPSETQAVLGEAQKLRDALQKTFAGEGPSQPMNRKPDAGRFLLMVSGQPRPPQGP